MVVAFEQVEVTVLGRARDRLGTRTLPPVPLLDIDDDAVAAAVDGGDDGLAGPVVADGTARGLDAARERRFADEPVTPDRVEQLLLAHDPWRVRHELDQHVEDLGLDGDPCVGASQLVEIEIQLDSGEGEDQRAAPSVLDEAPVSRTAGNHQGDIRPATPGTVDSQGRMAPSAQKVTMSQTRDPDARSAAAPWPIAVTCVAAAIVIVTVVGVVRILAVSSNGETEVKFWVALVTLLIGLTFATVVGTCAVLLRRGLDVPLEHPATTPDGQGWPPPPPPVSEPEYVPGAGPPRHG